MSKIIIPLNDSGDARFTKGCAHRVVNDRNSLYTQLDREPPGALVQMLMEQGLEHENQIFSLLEEIHGCQRFSGESPEDIVAGTLWAMDKGEFLILAGALPTTGGRSGRPDVLVRYGTKKNVNGKWGYLPIDIKLHSALTGTAKELSWSVSTLHAPSAQSSTPTVIGAGRPDEDDCLQLAHYWVMLCELGRAADIAPCAGTIDKDSILLWRSLEEKFWKHDDPFTRERAYRSALEISEIEWAFRWQAIQNSLTSPLWKNECSTCHWKHVCYEELSRKSHLSLLAGVTQAITGHLEQAGIETMQELAQLDMPTAIKISEAKANKMSLRDYVGLAQLHGNTSDSIEVLTGRKKNDLGVLHSLGMHIVGDLLGLDPLTCSIKPFADLSHVIDVARVRLQDGAEPFLPRNITIDALRRADIEVDIDMENFADVVYLWGTYLTEQNAARTVDSGSYRAFHTFVGADPSDEGLQLAALWEWMHDLISRYGAAGKSVRFYCYSHAEKDKMLQVAQRWPGLVGMPTKDQIEDFLASEHWVDLHKFVTQLIWPTDGHGLKLVAPLAGFSWRAQDAGGDNSMKWYELAMMSPDPAERQAMKDKLLEYNEDDVIATLKIRRWLDEGLHNRSWRVRSVTELDGLYS